jgi:hypothetical protein
MIHGGILGIVQHEESRPTDETFASSHYGTFNVSLIRRKINQGIVPYELQKIGIEESIIKGNANVDVNPERLKELTYEKILKSSPLITVNCEDGYHIVIDGSHRLRWLIDNKRDFFIAAVIDLSKIKAYMIVFMESFDNGKTWKECDKEEIAKIGYGEFPHHHPDYNDKFEKAKREM